MIPEEAVEAAAEVIAGGLRTQSIASLARAALEAAAPIIAAAVLNEAADRADEQEITSNICMHNDKQGEK